MCLMLYVGTTRNLPPQVGPDLRIEHVEEARRSVRRWFSLPEVRFVGAHTGCSCGFPSVIAESPVRYYEGMLLPSDDREADVRSVRALIGLLGQVGPPIELYPIADGDEDTPPRGVIEWSLGALEPERFFFNERFLHVIRPGDGHP